MLVQGKIEEKTCCFYVSDFHLEMILVPYINEKIDENITILTDKNLRETIKILISKMNLDDEKKEKILNLGWEGKNKVKENTNIIIIGNRNYIKNKNDEIKDRNIISILDCYDFEEEKNNIQEIVKQYKNILNTLGKNTF